MRRQRLELGREAGARGRHFRVLEAHPDARREPAPRLEAHLVGLVVGVAISLIQALTQIQEMTLVFVPKILAIFVTMLLALPFMGDALQAHMARIAARITGG